MGDQDLNFEDDVDISKMVQINEEDEKKEKGERVAQNLSARPMMMPPGEIKSSFLGTEEPSQRATARNTGSSTYINF